MEATRASIKIDFEIRLKESDVGDPKEMGKDLSLQVTIPECQLF